MLRISRLWLSRTLTRPAWLRPMPLFSIATAKYAGYGSRSTYCRTAGTTGRSSRISFSPRAAGASAPSPAAAATSQRAARRASAIVAISRFLRTARPEPFERRFCDQGKRSEQHHAVDRKHQARKKRTEEQGDVGERGDAQHRVCHDDNADRREWGAHHAACAEGPEGRRHRRQEQKRSSHELHRP